MGKKWTSNIEKEDKWKKTEYVVANKKDSARCEVYTGGIQSKQVQKFWVVK